VPRRGKVEDDAVAEVEDDGSMVLPCIAASVQRVGVELLCPSCGGRMKVIAEISDERVARKMLAPSRATSSNSS
jgi:hypothetical protein